jgi:hypothetical protein
MSGDLAKALSLLFAFSSLPAALFAKSLHSFGEFWLQGSKYEMSVDSDSIKQSGTQRRFNLHQVFDKLQTSPSHRPFQRLIYAYQVDCTKRAYSVSLISFYLKTSDSDSAPESVLQGDSGWTVPESSDSQAKIIDYVCGR